MGCFFISNRVEKLIKINTILYVIFSIHIMYQFFSYVFISVGLFIPIVIWAYVFTFIDGSSLAKKRSLFGILAGVVSVIPILYME